MKTIVMPFCKLVARLSLLLLVAISLTSFAKGGVGRFEDPTTLNSINLDENWENLVVVIHGWNPNRGISNKFSDGYWKDLRLALAGAIKDPNWKAVLYDWTSDATTPSAWSFPWGQEAIDLASDVAVKGVEHGSALQSLLKQKCPRLRQVHLIAHSAGTWVAETCLKQLMVENPFIVSQITLLDAYVPRSVGFPFYAHARLYSTPWSLTEARLNQITQMGFNARLHRADHYYVDDLTRGTGSRFTGWRTRDYPGVQIDAGGNCYQSASDQHSVPILMYAHSCMAANALNGQQPSGACLNDIGNYGLTDLGWYKSLYYQRGIRPAFVTQMPISMNVVRGQPLGLSVTAERATRYRWFFRGANNSWVQYSNVTTPVYSPPSSDVMSGTYVVEISNDEGVLYSRECFVAVVDAPPEPTPADPSPKPPLVLLSVSPSTFQGATGDLILTGRNFIQSCTLEFRKDGGAILPSQSQIHCHSSSTITYTVAVGGGSGNWEVRVVHTDGTIVRRSEWKSFTVTPSPPPPPPTPTTGSLTVAIAPPGARLLGAQWNVAGGEYRNTAETVSNLPPGAVTVKFKPVAGFSTPPDQTVSIVAGNLTSIAVTYTAVAAPANYTLTLNALNGAVGRSPELASYPPGTIVRLWTSPNSGYHFDSWTGDLTGTNSFQDIVMDKSKTITAIFAPGDWTSTSLTVTLEPAEVRPLLAQWRVDGGAWQNSGIAIPNQHLGDNYIEFKSVPGWYTPAAQQVRLTGGQGASLTGTYTRDIRPGLLQVALYPPAAVTAGARWRVGTTGAWQENGASLSLPPGSYTVEFQPVAAWNMPASVTVIVPNGATATTSGTYGAPLGLPIINAISPPFGPPAGGTTLTIYGANFGLNSTVTIGGVAAPSVSVIDSTQILATTPPRAALGTAAVAVTSGGQTASSNAFAYAAALGTGMELISNRGGRSFAVAANAGNVFIGEGASLVITGTTTTPEVGRVLVPNQILDIALFSKSGRNYACLAADAAGLQIVDVTTLAQPVLVGSVPTSGVAGGIAILGNTAYVAVEGMGLMIADITNPSAPTLRSELTVVGGGNDVAVRTTASGLHCYLTTNTGLAVVQADSPESPVYRTTNTEAGIGYGVVINGGRAYAASDRNIIVYDLSNAASPTMLAVQPAGFGSFGIATSGSYVYSADSSTSGLGSGLNIYQITAGGLAARVFGSFASNYSRNVAVSGNRAFVATGDLGTRFYNISGSATPTEAARRSVSGSCESVDVSGSLALVGTFNNGLSLYDVANPGMPVELKTNHSLGADTQITQVRLKGTQAFVLQSNAARFNYVNVSNPSSPVAAGVFDTAVMHTFKFVLSGNSVLCSGSGPNGLSPYRVGVFPGFGVTVPSASAIFPSESQPPHVIAASGAKAVTGLAGAAAGLRFLDITNLNSPALAATAAVAGTVKDVEFTSDGRYCLVGTENPGTLQVFDAANLNAPAKVAELPLPVRQISVSGQRAAVVSDRLVKVFDVAVPAAPVEVASSLVPGYPGDLKIEGDYIYSPGGGGGLGILRLNDLTPPAVFISSPTFAPTLDTSASTIDIAGSVTDDRLVARVSWSNDSGGGGAGTLTGENWSVDAIPLNPGPNEITVTALDSSGNFSQDILTVTRMLAVRQNQTLTFGTVPDQSFGGAPVILTATSSSGLPVSFSVVSGPATINGPLLTLTAAGTVTVRASQNGNWAYNAAAPVERVFSAGKATQQISWTAIDDQVLGGAPLTLHAQATSGLAITFSVISGPATVAGNQCTLTGQGEVVLRAAQAGNASYFAGSSDIAFAVMGSPQTITFGPLAQQLVGASAFPLAGVSSSGFPLTFSIVSGPAVIIEGSLHITGPGLVIVRASANGSATVAPAYVEQAFAVLPGVNIITDQQALESGSGYFRFWGEQGRLYEFQRSSNLQAWVTEETLTVNGLGYIDYIHGLPAGGQKLFYRVKAHTEPLVTPPPGMGYIPSGTFQMGDSFNEGSAAEVPVHSVAVAGFFMDQYEVDREQWDDVRSWGNNHGYTIGTANSVGPGHPVYSNTWDDAVKVVQCPFRKGGT